MTCPKLNIKWYEFVVWALMFAGFIYKGSFLVFFFYGVGLNLSYCIGILPDHDSIDTVNNHSSTATDWGEVQVRNSGNFVNGNFMDIYHHLFGGINYQIEHHLFPTVSHIHLPKIAPIVKAACEEFNIPYNMHPSIWEAMDRCLETFYEFAWDPESKNSK